MQDKAIKLAQCTRCQAYVWSAQVSGILVAVDPAPLGSLGDVMGALGASRSVFEVRSIGSKPQALRWLGAPGTQWEPGGRHLVASHGCGAQPRDAVAVETTPQGPQEAPVTPGRHSGGFRPAHAPDSGSQGRTAARHPAGSSATRRSPATPANRPRFERIYRTLKCAECGETIKAGEQYVAIEHYRYSWACHDYDCTDPYRNYSYDAEKRAKAAQVGYDVTNQLYRKGHWDRPVEDVIKGL
jgi:hypothetical protein